MRWSTLHPNELGGSGVFVSGERLIGSEPTSRALFESWEQNHWDPHAVELEPDWQEWQSLGSALRHQIEQSLSAFVIGEYTGLDLLAPIMAGSPTSPDLRFIGTQIADESRHSLFMFRLADTFLGGRQDESAALAAAWNSLTPSYRALNSYEATLAKGVMSHTTSYGAWVKHVALFHLITEGVLAYESQRAIAGSLRRRNVLAGITQGFTMMARDESRHIAFGLSALRTAVIEGYSNEILETLSVALPLALTVQYPASPTRVELTFGRRAQSGFVGAAKRRLGQIGIDPRTSASLLAKAQVDAEVIVNQRIASA